MQSWEELGFKLCNADDPSEERNLRYITAPNISNTKRKSEVDHSLSRPCLSVMVTISR